MSDLLTELRKHDLPPKWDGFAVIWHAWEVEPPVFVCPPPRPRCCEGCGSLTEPVLNRGLVGRFTSTTHDEIRADLENRKRLGPLAHKRKPRALWRLRAMRCPDCRLDTIWDTDTDQWWTLDHTDYGDEGSA